MLKMSLFFEQIIEKIEYKISHGRESVPFVRDILSFIKEFGRHLLFLMLISPICTNYLFEVKFEC